MASACCRRITAVTTHRTINKLPDMENRPNPGFSQNRSLIVFLLLGIFAGSVYVGVQWLTSGDDSVLLHPPRMDVFGELPPAREYHPSFLDKLPPGYHIIVFNDDLNGDGKPQRVAVHRMLVPVDALAFIHGLGFDFALHGLILYESGEEGYEESVVVDQAGFRDVGSERPLHVVRAFNGFAFRMRMLQLRYDGPETTIFEFMLHDESGYPFGDVHTIFWHPEENRYSHTKDFLNMVF